MIQMFQMPFMVNALIGTSLLIILLSYFGLHVVKRSIVFIDLALAQIASLGVAFAVLLDIDPILCSMIFTLAGATIFFFIDIKNTKIPQESIIGAFYVVSSAASIIVLSKAAHSDQDVIQMLFGNVLAINTQQIVELTIAIIAIGFIHFIYRKNFTALTFNESINRNNLWNFLFYITLAIAIAISIRSAGVLLVFSYLIIPAIAALLLSDKFIYMLITSIIFGIILNFFGIYESYVYDLPTGSTIITNLGVGLLLILTFYGIYKKIFQNSTKDNFDNKLSKQNNN